MSQDSLTLYQLMPNGYHPHGLTAAEYGAIFTTNKPCIFNFHSYPWLVHRLTYQREGQQKMHVRGYKEKGNIDTPLELAIRNEVSLNTPLDGGISSLADTCVPQADRFSLAMAAIDNLKDVLGNTGSAAREKLMDMRTRAMNHAYETGMDVEEFENWTWPF